jgi:cyclic beta-1,2-glucan synthetase
MSESVANFRSQQISGEIELIERLKKAARVAASWDVVYRPSSPGSFRARTRAASRTLAQLEKELFRPGAKQAMKDPRLKSARSALLVLLDHHRQLRAALSAVSARPKMIARLPRVLSSAGHDEPRAAAIAHIYLDVVNGDFNTSTFAAFVDALQEHEPLTLDELWNVSAFLRFALLESLLRDAQTLMYSAKENSVPNFSIRVGSLRTINMSDWVILIEPLILFDCLLFQDPEQTYGEMDFESRQLYRKRIAFIARHSDCTESEVAQAALDLARDGTERSFSDPRMQRRRNHVGYYLIDTGFARLAALVGFHPPLAWRAGQFARNHAEDCYLGGILLFSLLILSLALFPALPQFASIVPLVIAVLAILPSAMQNAVDLVNQIISALMEPEPLPKLDFSKGIPGECATLVAVPSLLLNERQVRELVTQLEVRYLANRDSHLHFALLTDLPDSISKPREEEAHPLVELAVRLIDDLNAKYGARGGGSFVLLHRHRIYNNRQGVWMSWERKRGKLLDLNKFLAGEFDAFPIQAGRIDLLPGIRYVLTLDSDTQLPRGSAARLAGAIAHPLNQAVIDPKLRIVTAGYGILQPRVGIAVRSAARSRLAAILSGQTGFDIYTRAISDAYQDLFAEGIFTGKGIYEVATLHAVLNRRFPRNELLSHDLIEGAYARAGLATDIEVIDDYPSHYSAYSRRLHRWVRGDWQIAQWMFSRVPDESGRSGPNPISAISRWKIFDNLRRSLLDPSLLFLFCAGWLGLPGGPLYWTLAALGLLAFPAIIQLVFSLGRAIAGGNKGQPSEALAGFGRACLVALLHLVLLAHQTMLAFDAVIRSLIRRFVTGERLLEWETAAQAELESVRRSPVDRYLATMCFTALALAAAVWLFAVRNIAMLYAAPMLMVWAFSGFATAWLNQPPRERSILNRADKAFLLTHALCAWRYFFEFSSERHNYLIPDNVQEDGYYETCRVSPTNIGLLLNARQAACELGFLTAPEFATLTSQTLATIERLEKFRGNFYNWYDTQTLRPLESFISTVDSGNFVASLYTLHAGVRDLGHRPLLESSLSSCLRAYWRMMCADKSLPIALSRVRLPKPSATFSAWLEWTVKAESALIEAIDLRPSNGRSAWWLTETLRRVSALRTLVRKYLPWMLLEFKPLRETLQIALDDGKRMPTIQDAMFIVEDLLGRIDRAHDTLAANPSQLGLAGQLRELLSAASENLPTLATDLDAIGKKAERLVDATEFAFLVNPGRKILSIGYDAGPRQISEYSYDLFASEARIATFLAVARGDLPQQSWFKLDREHVRAYGRFLPYSWTGTMFEYLMPGLWMRNYRGTLIARTESACVYVQRAFAAHLGIPWGISESGTARRDDNGHYLYHAYGLPCVALSPSALAGPVISPYSTFLALGSDAPEALNNLRRMVAAGWVGAYGLYEAADYTGSLRTPVLVREWMAHHQGMSLLAITNLLHQNVVQRWFHANPLIQSAEMLLHEIPTSIAVLRATQKELGPTGSA